MCCRQTPKLHLRWGAVCAEVLGCGSAFDGYEWAPSFGVAEACRNMYTMHIDISDPNEKAGWHS